MKNFIYYAMQRIGEYKNSDVASTLKARDYKDITDIIIVFYDENDKLNTVFGDKDGDAY